MPAQHILSPINQLGDHLCSAVCSLKILHLPEAAAVNCVQLSKEMAGLYNVLAIVINSSIITVHMITD